MSKQLKKLSRVMLAAIELLVSKPNITIADLSRELGVHYQTCYAWLRSDIFNEALQKRLQEHWKDAARKAQLRMEDLIQSPKDEVALNASKYVLDSAGFNAVQKVEIDNSTIRVEVIDD